jgi:hypothetical protein
MSQSSQPHPLEASNPISGSPSNRQYLLKQAIDQQA